MIVSRFTDNQYLKTIGLLWKLINKWEIFFQDVNKFQIVTERLKFMKHGQEAQSREKPHHVIQRLWRTALHEAVNHIKERGYNIHQRWVGTTQAKVVMRNNNDEEIEDNLKGTYFTKGYGTAKKANWEKITDITNDDLVFKEFIEPRINHWKYKDEKLTYGYAWTLVSVSEIVITFLPSTEVKNAESENIDFDIGDEFVVQYPSWMINSMSGVKTTMKKTNGSNCFFMAILFRHILTKSIFQKHIC